MKPDISLIAAHKDYPKLRRWNNQGGNPIEIGERIDDVRAPSVSTKGWIAFQFVSRGLQDPWLSGTAVMDDNGELLNLLPAALPTTASAWSPKGNELARIVTDQMGGTRLEIINLSNWDSRIIFDRPGITALSWTKTDELLVAEGPRLISINLSEETIFTEFEWETAANFLLYGSDDFYPSIVHISCLEEKRVIEVRWHRQGKTAISSIYQWLENDLSHMSMLDSHRHPILLRNKEMLLSTDEAIVGVNEKGKKLWIRPIPGLISAVPC